MSPYCKTDRPQMFLRSGTSAGGQNPRQSSRDPTMTTTLDESRRDALRNQILCSVSADENCAMGGSRRPATHFCTGQRYSMSIIGFSARSNGGARGAAGRENFCDAAGGIPIRRAAGRLYRVHPSVRGWLCALGCLVTAAVGDASSGGLRCCRRVPSAPLSGAAVQLDCVGSVLRALP